MVKERLMTAGEVASYLSCSLSTVRRLVARDEIPYFRLGKMVRFRRADIDAWLALHQGGEIPGESSSAVEGRDQLSLFDATPAIVPSP